jgi:hypothetical protein
MTVALLAAGGRFIVMPCVKMLTTTGYRIEDASTLLRRYRLLAAQRVMFEKQISQLEKRAATADLAYLQAPSDALAGAELLDLTRSVIENAGGKVSSAEVLSADSTAGTPWSRRISVSVQASLSINSLAKTLYALETGKTYVTVDELIVRDDGSGHTDKSESEVVLAIMLKVFGYRLTKSGTER